MEVVTMEDDIMVQLAAMFTDDEIEALLPAIEKYHEWCFQIIEQRYALCNRIRCDLQQLSSQLRWANHFVNESARQPDILGAHGGGSPILNSVMKHVGRGLFQELPALRNASREMASVVFSLRGHIPLLSASVAEDNAKLLLGELENADWDEPYSDSFEHCIHGEARARQLCMKCTVYRIWSLAPGCAKQLQYGWPFIREAIDWAKAYGMVSPYCCHPDVLAVRTELVEMGAAMGYLDRSIALVHGALELPEPVHAEWHAQASKELEALRQFLRRHVDHCVVKPLATIVDARIATEEVPKDSFFQSPDGHLDRKCFVACEDDEEVIEDMQHSDHAAVIPADEAECIAMNLWATSVERLATHVPDKTNHLTLITFSRHSAALHQAILASPLAHNAIADGVDVQPHWANGAFVLLPIQAEDIDFEFHPRHVLVSGESDVLSLLAALEHLPYMQRKLKPDGLVTFPDASSHLQGVSSVSGSSSSVSYPSVVHEPIDFVTAKLLVRKTFIHYSDVPQAATRGSRSA